MSIKKWKFVYSDNPDELSEFVNDWIEQGWQPFGGIAVDKWMNGRIFYQALVRYEKDDNGSPNG